MKVEVTWRIITLKVVWLTTFLSILTTNIIMTSLFCICTACTCTSLREGLFCTACIKLWLGESCWVGNNSSSGHCCCCCLATLGLKTITHQTINWMQIWSKKCVIVPASWHTLKLIVPAGRIQGNTVCVALPYFLLHASRNIPISSSVSLVGWGEELPCQEWQETGSGIHHMCSQPADPCTS